jgi:hypothetical protein
LDLRSTTLLSNPIITTQNYSTELTHAATTRLSDPIAATQNDSMELPHAATTRLSDPIAATQKDSMELPHAATMHFSDPIATTQNDSMDLTHAATMRFSDPIITTQNDSMEFTHAATMRFSDPIATTQNDSAEINHNGLMELTQFATISFQNAASKNSPPNTASFFGSDNQQSAKLVAADNDSKPNKDLLQKNFQVNGHVYRRLGDLGKGGSCKVYKVVSQTGQIFALKKVKLKNQDPTVAEGYRNEISLLKRLQNNANIIRLYESQYMKESEHLIMVFLANRRFWNVGRLISTKCFKNAIMRR